jgi:hypothetical protein
MKAMQLLRSRKGTEAEELLQQAIQNCEDDPEPAYNLSIALAEVLIFQVCNFPDPCCKQKPSGTAILKICIKTLQFSTAQPQTFISLKSQKTTLWIATTCSRCL